MPIIQGKLADGRQPLVKIRISNEVGIPDDLYPGVQQSVVWALLDTGATKSALDEDLCRELSLVPQGLIAFLGAGMDSPMMVERYAASVSIFLDHRRAETSDWSDIVSFTSVRMHDRPFKAV